MDNQITNLIVFIFVCLFSYFVFRNINLNHREGMTTDASGNNAASVSNGIAGNATAYASNIKSQVIQIQDQLLISKYRTDYENVVLSMDDLINTLMVKATLSIDKSNPEQGLNELVNLNNAKIALNNVMTVIDASS